MKLGIMAGLLALSLATPALAQNSDRGSNWQDALHGLLSGNDNQDQAVRNAYERGYQRGREDEARNMRNRGSRDEQRGYDNGRSYERGGSGHYDTVPGDSTYRR